MTTNQTGLRPGTAPVLTVSASLLIALDTIFNHPGVPSFLEAGVAIVVLAIAAALYPHIQLARRAR